VNKRRCSKQTSTCNTFRSTGDISGLLFLSLPITTLCRFLHHCVVSIYVSAEDYEEQERTIDLLDDVSAPAKSFVRSEHFILGGPGFPFYYRGNIKVPFQPLDDLIAVALTTDNKSQQPQHQPLNIFDSLLSSVVSSPTYSSPSLSELRTRFENS